MDPWKPIRLWLCIAVCVGFLAAGAYARLRWGVPDEPYGCTYAPVNGSNFRIPRSANPFRELRLECGGLTREDVWGERERFLSE